MRITSLLEITCALTLLSACGPSDEEIKEEARKTQARQERRAQSAAHDKLLEAREKLLFEMDGFTKGERSMFERLQKKQGKSPQETAAFLELWANKKRHQGY